MATRIESGQMQLARPGGVPMVQAQMPTVQPIGFQVAAQEQGRMAQLIQRMSESLFKEAGQMAEQEGFRYAAENPLTDEEIALARDGAITKPTGRIFDDAFRKARSLQLSSHFEAEGINNMSRLLPDIEAGRITSEQVILKLREMNSGFTASLAKLEIDVLRNRRTFYLSMLVFLNQIEYLRHQLHIRTQHRYYIGLCHLWLQDSDW